VHTSLHFSGCSANKIHRNIRFLFITLLASCFASLSLAATLEDFGQLQSIRGMSISPDGNRYAWIQEQDNARLVVVYDANLKKAIGGLRLDENLKARYVDFASNDHLILHASKSHIEYGYRGKFEYSGAAAYDINTNKVRTLLRGTEDLHPAQSGLGKIVGVNEAEKVAYMPAYDNASDAQYNLYKVSLSNGKGRLYKHGRADTFDWFVDKQGNVLAREDFDEKRGEHSFYSYLTGTPKKIYSYSAKIPEISVQAVAWDEKGLLFIKDNDNSHSVHRLSLEDGNISEALFYRQDQEIDHLETNKNRKLLAVKYIGFLPSYQFENAQKQAKFDQILQYFPASSVDYLGQTEDENKYLLRVSGNTAPNAFYFFDSKANKLSYLTKGYANITDEDLGEVIAFRYPARDGMKIPAILTWPTHAQTEQQRSQLPLIALPHGGPGAYDAVQFDWLAQYLAYKGYAVLQPNFRGSTGFGNAFYEAGKGRWGKEMQDDITDGVEYLAKKGIIDPNRVCIVGATYGGYAALAGGAFTPDLYRCVVAINGVSDINAEITADIRDSSRANLVRNYWQEVFGEDKGAFKALDNVSPYFYAERFRAPTLIIYSKDDTVVNTNQSLRMHKALKKANRETTLVQLPGEDHWLSTGPMRMKLLQTIEGYLDTHNPANQPEVAQK